MLTIEKGAYELLELTFDTVVNFPAQLTHQVLPTVFPRISPALG